jgi:hypothetical protein
MSSYKIHVSHDRAVLDEDNQLVVMARTPGEASLFAAAPELLAALKALLESIENVNFGVHDDDGQTYDAIPWAQAEDAIAKATGEVRA